jgi:glutamate--cysteine ligase
VREVADRIGVGFIGLGAAPIWKHEDMPMMPKGRYRLMTDYMDRVGTLGKTMMYRTCTVQVNLDFASEADMVKKLRVALALQPVATALFANSPFIDGAPNGHKSWRSRVWRDLDADRTGMLPFVFEDGFGFQAWVDYALDVPMYFVYRDGKYIDALGQSFRDFLKGLACAAGRGADAERLGRPPDHAFPRGADQEVHRDARRRWRSVAAALRAARVLGGVDL